MPTKANPDDLFTALESLRPDPDRQAGARYIGRHEAALRTVLTRASTENSDADPHAPAVALLLEATWEARCTASAAPLSSLMATSRQ